ncbi:MAG: hypothetical protein KAR03_03475 [Candidatus Thorarchaeota archaeon]|nr:hypothetical protein [Candidatus Thorarchaeota archaeon]
MAKRGLVFVKNLARDTIVQESDDTSGNVLRQTSIAAQPQVIGKIIITSLWRTELWNFQH